MQARCVAALDQGTTSTRCILFDTRGDILALARRELAWVPRHDDLERIVSDALSWEAMLTRKNSPSR